MAVQLSTTLLLWAVNTAAPNKAFKGACMKIQGRTLTNTAFLESFHRDVTRGSHLETQPSEPLLSSSPSAKQNWQPKLQLPPAKRAHPTTPASQGNGPSMSPLLWHDLAPQKLRTEEGRIESVGRGWHTTVFPSITQHCWYEGNSDKSQRDVPHVFTPSTFHQVVT